MEILLLRGILLVFCTFFNLVLAFLLFGKRKENKVSFHLGFVALFSALYCFTCALSDLSAKGPFSYSIKLFWTRATWLGILILPAYFTFLYYFTRKTRHIRLKAFLWYLTAGIIAFLSLTTPYFIESINTESSEILIKPGILNPLGRFYIIFAITTGLIYILRDYFQSRGLRRLQIKYLVLGLVIYSIGGILFTGILPLLKGKTGPYTDISALLSSVWVGLTSYTIIRYRLMDIGVAPGKTVAFLFSLFTVFWGIFLIIFIQYQLPVSVSFFQLLPLILLFSFGLLQLNKFYENLTRIYFYPGFFKRKIIVSDLEKELYCLLEMKKLSYLLTETLKKTFDLNKIAILTKKPRKEGFHLQKVLGFKKKEILKFSKDESFLALVKKNKKPFGTQEILIPLKKVKAKEEKEKLKSLNNKLKELKIEVVIPLLFERKVIGIIFLGERFSSEAFSEEDIELLATFSLEASVALRNTLLYSEVKKRKEDLERFYRLTVEKGIKILKLEKKVLELEKKLKKTTKKGLK
ncbi:MAG: histidine kinase N-terminal 7TM domain-containing protein [Candidatus Nealsonbacteria bacterium]